LLKLAAGEANVLQLVNPDFALGFKRIFMHVAALIFALSLTHAGMPAAGSHSAATAPRLSVRHHHRRVVFYYSPIKGSRESLLRQNQRVAEDGLQRIQDDAQLEELTRNGQLVSLPLDRFVTADPSLPLGRRYCRPWTRAFVEDIGQNFYANFRSGLKVTSAVRTADYQHYLRRRNHNAAAEDGDAASPHLTGATIDIAKSGMNRRQLNWARDYLLRLQTSGLLDAEEEFRKRVFHITVYKDYASRMASSSQPITPAAVTPATALMPIAAGPLE
jgi:hypothetical protein